ncbi:hypothetical protein G1H11_13505 [Phytoactinopolyspora alkaliphila]|uniref:Uncharacterized protein n=1 Tax=Phytoactinopolyspora alkaliphila TaxID=1783498 RepID=A0A6N9YN06_9ACTN|nr:hypothetical protein [Phytoactinopolyspora alkaliphila]NED96325.1 hypothetical protein [Phytoactinopolyspora alkaliphila]
MSQPDVPDSAGGGYDGLRVQPGVVEWSPPELDLHVPELEPPIVLDPPTPPEPPQDSQVSREELELALERAKLVAEDCATILQPAVQAMLDGAWVSRRADEFSLALEEHARMATSAGAHPVRVIEHALDQRLETGDPLQPGVFMPQPEVGS